MGSLSTPVIVPAADGLFLYQDGRSFVSKLSLTSFKSVTYCLIESETIGFSLNFAELLALLVEYFCQARGTWSMGNSCLEGRFAVVCDKAT